jgi:hypothetical protein
VSYGSLLWRLRHPHPAAVDEKAAPVREYLLKECNRTLNKDEALALVDEVIQRTGQGRLGRAARASLTGSLMGHVPEPPPHQMRAHTIAMAARAKLRELPDPHEWKLWYPPGRL